MESPELHAQCMRDAGVPRGLPSSRCRPSLLPPAAATPWASKPWASPPATAPANDDDEKAKNLLSRCEAAGMTVRDYQVEAVLAECYGHAGRAWAKLVPASASDTRRGATVRFAAASPSTSAKFIAGGPTPISTAAAGASRRALAEIA